MEWLFAVAAVLAVAGLRGYAGHAHAHIVEHIDRQVRSLERTVMSTTQDAVNAVVAQLRRAKLEIVSELEAVQAQVDAGEDVDLSALTEAAQALDDVVAVDVAPEDLPVVVEDPAVEGDSL